VQKIVKAYERYNEVIGANRQMSLKLTDSPKVTDVAKLIDGPKPTDSPKLTDAPPREAAPEPVTPSNTAA
jgi:hypothetical protein